MLKNYKHIISSPKGMLQTATRWFNGSDFVASVCIYNANNDEIKLAGDVQITTTKLLYMQKTSENSKRFAGFFMMKSL